MKKILSVFLFLISTTVFAQSTCENADFSMGDFTNWTGSTGRTSSASDYSNIVSGIVPGPLNAGPGITQNHTIMNAPGTDPNTQDMLSVLPPGGSSSCRLGNDYVAYQINNTAVPWGFAERLSYALTVDPTNCIFTYQYAVVLQDPDDGNHGDDIKPGFDISITDNGGNLVDPVCGQYHVIASDTLTGYTQCPPRPGCSDPNYDVMWKDWTSVALDVSNFMGQTIYINFTTRDCGISGHFGYAYISCYCGSLQLTQACLGANDIVSAPGGFESYVWSTGETTNPITVANPVYGDSIYVTCTPYAGTGCDVKIGGVLTYEPPVFTISPDSSTICQGSSVSLTVTPNLAGSYTYTWTPTTGLSSATGQTVTASPTHTTTYTVSGTSGGGCGNTAEVTIYVDSAIVANLAPDMTICYPNSVTLDASASTGIGPLTYNWSNSYTGPTQTLTPTTTTTYTVTVTNAGVCSDSESIQVQVYFHPEANVTFTDAKCNNSNTGTATATPTSGLPPFTYQWSTTPVQTTATATGLNAGTYYVTVTDNGGCDTVLSVTISEPSALTLIANTTTNVSCYGGNQGSATASASGGTPGTGYTYLWNSSPAQNTATATGLTAGTYIVTVTDANNCTATQSVLITQPQQMTLATDADSVLCYGQATGSITVTPTGGTPNYSYAWNTTPPQTGATAVSLYQGTYTVTVTDNNGCTTTATTIVSEPQELISHVADSLLALQCYGYDNGYVTINVQGGIAPWTFEWNTTPPQYSMTANDLPAGSYTCTITDAHGCTLTHSVIVTQPPILSVQADSLNEECLNFCDGQATSAVTGGVPPYTYAWYDSDGSMGLSSYTITNICPGYYYLMITDNNGCVEYDTTIVGTDNIVTADFTAQPISGLIPLEVFFTYTGTTSPSNSYFWDFGDGYISQLENPSHTYTEADTFTVMLIVTDGLCTDTAYLLVYPEQPSLLIVPNVFTPNGDGINDEFYFTYQSIKDFHAIIFNRWGKLIYQWYDITHGWDGRMDNGEIASDGVYYYIIEASGYDDVPYEMHGTVTLIK